MNWSVWLPVLVIGVSLLTGVLIFPLSEERTRLRTALNLVGAAVKVVLVAAMIWGTATGTRFEARAAFMPGWEIVLRADFLALLFAALSAGLWLVTTIYAIGYLENSPHRSRFFGFFSLCVGATMGIALSGNLLTFFVFYELLTVVTYPLVVHRGRGPALAAGRTYLLYTLFGGTLVLLAAVWLHLLTGPVDFATGGVVAPLIETHGTQLRMIFGVLIVGLGVKAALVPLHGWLPEAMIAPAPVSALLHAVAVVKAGAFGIVRVVYDVYGITAADSLGLLPLLAAAAAFTIIYGSVRALSQDDLKRRLAFSTVSQLSYIILGVAIIGPMASIGGMVHLIHQGIMKVTLFFCAGVLSETLGIHSVSQMRGVGRRLPLTMAAFTIAAFGLIGVPPTAGFVSKWYLALGGVETGALWVLVIMAVSSVLNAMYFLPILKRAWFDEPQGDWEHPGTEGHPREGNWLLVAPSLITGAAVLASGILAGVPFSPLSMAHLAVARIYGP